MNEKLPPRALPVVYFAFAHVALIVALGIVALAPREVAGFFYHPRMFAAVHLITLGWITCSILGATYLVAPFALRTILAADRVDPWLAALVVTGACGIVVSFWIERYAALAVAGLLAFAGLVGFAHRVWRALRDAKSPAGVRLLVGLAYGNVLLAAAVGLSIGIDRLAPFLPGERFGWVFGHAHLAVVGWAAMMVVGIGYRLLPMFLPAAPREGRSVTVCAVLLEGGLLLLALGLPFSIVVARAAALVVVAGLAVFFFDVARMLRNPRRPPPHLPRPDLGVAHALQALAYLLVSAGVGLYLLFAPGWQLGWIMAYGVCALLGFLGQIIIGMSYRLLPMFAWTAASATRGIDFSGPAPHELPSRGLQRAVLVLWTPGVPLLALGLAQDRLAWVIAGGWILGVAAVLAAANSARVMRHAFARR